VSCLFLRSDAAEKSRLKDFFSEVTTTASYAGNSVVSGHADSEEILRNMANEMPDSITQVLLAALNAVDDVVERDAEHSASIIAETVPAVKALTELSKLQIRGNVDDRQNRFVATIRLSMDKFKSAS